MKIQSLKPIGNKQFAVSNASLRTLVALFFILNSSLLAPDASKTMAQPRYDYATMNVEKLGRGVVAIRKDLNTVAISWRLLRGEDAKQQFDVYRNGEKITPQPLADGGTFFIDNNPVDGDAVYEVRGGNVNGSYTLKADSPLGYFPIKLNRPADGETPDGRRYRYGANDAAVGDVDGDGEYEIILLWSPSNAHDNAHDGFTGNVLFDCYRLNGEHLWRIDLGRNVRAGAHYVPFLVYDFDGDGKAELMVRTSDGTIDALGNVIGDSAIDNRHGAAEALKNIGQRREQAKRDDAERERMRQQWAQGQRPARPQGQGRNRQRGQRGGGVPMEGRILQGNDYLTVFNGLTGEAMATVDYVPQRGDPQGWGDRNANRSDRFLACVGYLDGKRASAVFCRGYYTRSVLAAWDWDGKELKQHWVFDSNEPQWNDYAGQGNHNLRVGDVDGDGCDEIVYGSMCVDHNGQGLYTTKMGHGDAIHMTMFSPKSDKLMVWDCHENRRDGSTFRDAATGKVIFQIKSSEDVGRCMAADIDPTNPGWEMWSLDSKGLRTIDGKALKNRQPRSCNFGIWWDGDKLRELLDGTKIMKYDWTKGETNDIMAFEDCQFINGTKSNPNISGDILGDWREEVVTVTRDNSELRVYSTTIPTDHRIVCLMQDIIYRHSMTAQNVAYNQPPEPGFYLGE